MRHKMLFNTFTADPDKALHFCLTGLTTIFNFWHSSALELRTECESAQCQKLKMALDPSNSSNLEQLAFKGLTARRSNGFEPTSTR